MDTPAHAFGSLLDKLKIQLRSTSMNSSSQLAWKFGVKMQFLDCFGFSNYDWFPEECVGLQGFTVP